MWSRTSTDSKICHSRWWAIHYLYEESYYRTIYGKHTSDFFVPTLKVRKYHQVIWTISKKKWQIRVMTSSLQSTTFSTRLKTFLSTGTWQAVPIHTLTQSSRHATFLTRKGNYKSPSNPGIVFFRSRKCGSRSKQIFTNPIKNSPRPDNWPLDKLDTDKQTSLKAS